MRTSEITFALTSVALPVRSPEPGYHRHMRGRGAGGQYVRTALTPRLLPVSYPIILGRSWRRLAYKRIPEVHRRLQTVTTLRVYRASDPDNPTLYRRGEIAEAEPAVPGWRMPVDDLCMKKESRPCHTT